MEVFVIKVPFKLGGAQIGSDLGPDAICQAGLRERLVEMGIGIRDVISLNMPLHNNIEIIDKNLRYLPQVIDMAEDLKKLVEDVLSKGAFPLILGGDHSISLGTLTGLARVQKEFGLIWMDAHGDFNTHETTRTGNIHGMSLAASLGLGASDIVNIGGIAAKVREEHTALVGVRELDLEERDLLRKSRVNIFTIRDIDKMGISPVIKQAISYVSGGKRPVYLSLDIDVLDPGVVAGTATPVVGGLTYREAQLAMELIADECMLVGMDVVEVNPILDTGGNKTAQLAVDLICTALGKKIF